MIKSKKFLAKLLEKEYLAEDILKIVFEAPNDFVFEAGQFFKILFDPTDKNTFRSYSILNPPSMKGVLQSAVKLVEGGYGTNRLVNAEIGTEFNIEAPLGVLTLNKDVKDNVLICTGTGITPFYSIIHEYIHMNDHMFTLIYGAKNIQELVFHEEFQKLASENKNFKYLPVLSREEWAGLQGRVQDHLFETPAEYKDKNFYICGLKDMIKDVRDKLLSNGVDWKNIHIERYD